MFRKIRINGIVFKKTDFPGKCCRKEIYRCWNANVLSCKMCSLTSSNPLIPSNRRIVDVISRAFGGRLKLNSPVTQLKTNTRLGEWLRRHRQRRRFLLVEQHRLAKLKNQLSPEERRSLKILDRSCNKFYLVSIDPSPPKKDAAAFNMSLARRSSAFSRFTRFSSAS